MDEIEVQCSHGYVISVRGANLIVRKRKNEEIIPISKIQSFAMKMPGLLGQGKISFSTAKAATSTLRWGTGVSESLGAEKVFWFWAQEQDAAAALRDYVQNYEANQNQFVQAHVTSAPEVNDIRYFKRLLDEGIITEEEFSKKKKELLGL